MEEGLFYAPGKRKTAVARVWMRPGTGEMTINKKPSAEYLYLETDRTHVMEPLVLTELRDKFDIYVNVQGGGVSGQAGSETG